MELLIAVLGKLTEGRFVWIGCKVHAASSVEGAVHVIRRRGLVIGLGESISILELEPRRCRLSHRNRSEFLLEGCNGRSLIP